MKKNIRIHTDQVIGTPNPGMWGIFFEEINHAGDGGLYAELIRNRNFAESSIPAGTVYAAGHIMTKNGFEIPFDGSNPLPGWKLKRTEDAIGCMDLYTEYPRNPECPYQLRLSALQPGRGVYACNEGFWGISLKPQAYHGYIILRSEGAGMAAVGFMHHNGTVLCRQEISVSERFEKVSFTLHSSANADQAYFFIEMYQSGILYVDFVSLFPEDTDLNRPFGFRKDLMDMLRALRPGFVRFPGGCVVEGVNLANAIQWKKTRGPIEDRPGHWSIWDYRVSDGLGMLEFCQLAEDLDADIMWVSNCGMSCQARKGELATEEELEQLIQDAIDAVEYICGDISTPYGALRAADGHPAPFRLKYVEIGNENFGDDYGSRYIRFYEALKAKYPQLILISNAKVPGAPIDMVDDHYYPRPHQFPSQHDLYRTSDVPVYVGEYACWDGGQDRGDEIGYGNMLTAASEASFMVHLENRCRHVRMASYAPLFCHVEDRKWRMNMISFDSRSAFGIPTYHIHTLFAQNPVDRVFATDCQIVSGVPSNLYVTAGEKDGKCIMKMVNFGTEAMEAVFSADTMQLQKGDAWLVAADAPAETNTLLYPDFISAVPVPVLEKGGCITITLPPYSFALVSVGMTAV